MRIIEKHLAPKNMESRDFCLIRSDPSPVRRCF